MDGKVCILLSYYKGEKFIDEQLDSIFLQDYLGDIDILIRNDGPVDEGILRLNSKDIPPNRSLNIYNGENIGPQRSFLDLIQKASFADYYFFSDQDDVWKPDKIRRAVDRLKCTDKPALWCCNYDLVDGEMDIIRENAVVLVQRTFHFLYAQMYNTFPGCVMGFNRQLYLILKKMNLNNCMMHDSLTFATAIATGKVFYEKRSLIYHRIHGENVVGTGFRKSTPLKWIRDKSRLLREKEAYDLSVFADRLLISSKVSKKWKDDVFLLRDYKKNMTNTLRLLNHRDIRKNIDPEMLSIHCKILFRLF